MFGSWSVDQRQGLLCLIAAVELQDAGPGTPNHRALRLGPRAFSISLVNSFGGILFGCTSLPTDQFQAEP